MAEQDTSRVRLLMVGILCLSLFGSLIARLWYLQVIGPEEFRASASTIHMRVIHEETFVAYGYRISGFQR